MDIPYFAIKQEVKGMASSLEEHTGIKFEWSELALLEEYYFKYNFNMFLTMQMFLLDIFDMDMTALDHSFILKQVAPNSWRATPYGLGLFGSEEFKQYCRERIAMWRDERNLI
ncbi:MAG: hypothetical protein M1338_05260 [Patescibacteria group bacterium]|nr:hypothetical protein [Patescibacteria group bacterium]